MPKLRFLRFLVLTLKMTTTFCWQIPTFCFHLFFVREFQPNELFVVHVESSHSFDLFDGHGEMFGDFERFVDHDETSDSFDLLVVQVEDFDLLVGQDESIEDSEVFVGQDELLDEFDLLVVPVESSDSLVFVGQAEMFEDSEEHSRAVRSLHWQKTGLEPPISFC